MKLSIWHQFSSNHSASFSLVAQFDTVDAAQVAAEEAQQILQAVLKWYDEAYPDEARDELSSKELLPLSPVEKELKQEKQLATWEDSIDWVLLISDAAEIVKTYENLVFMQSPYETWIGAQPFEELFARKAKILVCGQEAVSSSWPHLRLSCLAPSEAEAEAIIKPLAVFSKLAEIDLPNFGSYQGKISRDGLKLQFEDLPTSYLDQHKLHSAPDFLKALTAYLKEKGCKEFLLEVYGLDLPS